MGEQTWLASQIVRLSCNHDLARAINYTLRRWDAFIRFLDEGPICDTNNAAERALRCSAGLTATASARRCPTG